MAQFKNGSITKAGRSLIAKGIAGAEIKFSRLAIGSGVLPAGKPIDELTDLVIWVMNIPIVKKKQLGNGRIVVGGTFDNSKLTAEFYYREIGLFAIDPEEGEILYSYGNAGDAAEKILPSAIGGLISKSVDPITTISSAENVTVMIDPTGKVPIEMFNEAMEQHNVDIGAVNGRMDGFARQIQVFAEDAATTPTVRVASILDAQSWTDLVNVSLKIGALTFGTDSTTTLNVKNASGKLLGAKTIWFPNLGGSGITSTTPLYWVRTSGIYEVVWDGKYLTCLNPQGMLATEKYAGVVKLCTDEKSDSSTEAMVPNAVKKMVDTLVAEALKNQHPVGYVYLTQSKDDKPGDRFMGTWTLTSVDRTLRGASAADTGGATGGEDNVKLGTSNLPNHVHTIPAQTATANNAALNHTHSASGVLNNLGGHNHQTDSRLFAGGSINAGSPNSGSPSNGIVRYGDGGHDHGGVSVSVGYTDLTHGHSVTVLASSTNSTTGASAAEISIKNKYELLYIWKRTL